jgi:hypothetical protein
MELIELWSCLKEAEVEHVAEARRLVILVRHTSKIQ